MGYPKFIKAKIKNDREGVDWEIKIIYFTKIKNYISFVYFF